MFLPGGYQIPLSNMYVHKNKTHKIFIIPALGWLVHQRPRVIDRPIPELFVQLLETLLFNCDDFRSFQHIILQCCPPIPPILEERQNCLYTLFISLGKNACHQARRPKLNVVPTNINSLSNWNILTEHLLSQKGYFFFLFICGFITAQTQWKHLWI